MVSRSRTFAPALLFIWSLGGSATPAKAEPTPTTTLPTFGVCVVEYWEDGAERGYVTPVFSVLEDRQSGVFEPGNLYGEQDARDHPDTLTINVDELRNNWHGDGWNKDDVDRQFYAEIGGFGPDSGQISWYHCSQFATRSGATAFIEKAGYDQSRFAGWLPEGAHVVRSKDPNPAAIVGGTPKPQPKPKPTPTPTPKPQPAAASASSGALGLQTDTSLADAAKAWDAQVAKALAEEARANADRRASDAAKTAARDPKFDALLEAERERRRKCPMCQ